MVSAVIWVTEKINLADPGTKLNGPLTETLQLMQVSSSDPIDFTGAVTRLLINLLVNFL